jgi:hypothetical protein
MASPLASTAPSATPDEPAAVATVAAPAAPLVGWPDAVDVGVGRTLAALRPCDMGEGSDVADGTFSGMGPRSPVAEMSRVLRVGERVKEPQELFTAACATMSRALSSDCRRCCRAL